jgi:S-adenosylmethionine-dependent methyltransferase
MTTPAKFDSERFQSDAQKYAAYLETPEGRLRLELPLANLQEFLPLPTKPALHALDVGGGTGAISVRLARLGLHVTLLDSSQAMLNIAKRAAQDADITEKLALKHGDADKLADLFNTRSFDVIVCHNVLEFVGNPVVVLQQCARLMHDSSAILSVLVRSQAGEVLKAAMQSGDLAAAEKTLKSDWAEESLYGGAVRLFTPEALHTMLKSVSLQAIALRGVRVVSDYLPSKLPRAAEYDRIFALESKLGCRPEFAAVARYIHCLARSVNSDGG